MRKNRSKFSNAKYPNLYRVPNQPCWIFRKYSSEKRKEFYCSTGLESIDRNAPAAYKIGVERFNDWMGAFLPSSGTIYIRDLARAVLRAKDEDPEISDATYRSAKNQLENHIIPAFGHLKPDQVTSEKWRAYQRTERTRRRQRTLKDGTVKDLPPRKALFNTRKLLAECLSRAKEEKLIDSIPEFDLNDPEAAPPRYIPKEHMLKLIRAAGQIPAYKRGKQRIARSRYRAVPQKLLIFIMWKQGARPGEVLQYRWDMINWGDGTLSIPAKISKNRRSRVIPMNPKVIRILRFLSKHAKSPWLFPSPSVTDQPIKDYSTAWDSTTERVGLDYDMYNIRDTWITDRLRAGFSSVFIGKYCDNSATMIERRYAVAQEDIMRGVAG